MNILIPILGFDKTGGYRVLSRIATELTKKGCKVDFLVPDNSQEPYFPTEAGIIWTDATGKLLSERNKKKTNSGKGYFYISKALTMALRKKFVKEYKVIIVNHSLTSYPIILAGLKKKVVYLAQAYEPEYYQLKGGLKNKLIMYLSMLSYKMGFFTIANSNLYLKYKWLNAHRIITPGLDLSVFKPNVSTTLQQPQVKKVIRIGTIGRVEPQKGTVFILEAFKQLSKSYENIELHIAFSTEHDWGFIKNVFYSRPDGDDALAEYYRGLDYYVCAGIAQFGAVHYPVIEAMACGVPLISTPYYPLTEENGWLIEPSNSSSIVETIKKAINNPILTRKKTANAFESIQEFSWDIIANQMLEALLHK